MKSRIFGTTNSIINQCQIARRGYYYGKFTTSYFSSINTNYIFLFKEYVTGDVRCPRRQ